MRMKEDKMLRKRLIGLLLAVVCSATALVGCAPTINDAEVVATINGEEVTAGVVNFFTRMEQASMETYYGAYMGEDMWGPAAEGEEPYQDTVKTDVMTNIKDMYLVNQYAEEYGISLNEEELAHIAEAADSFISVNSEGVRSKVSGTKENIEEWLQTYSLYVKMTNEIEKAADTNVTDEEANQKKMTYVVFDKVTTNTEGATIELSEEEIANLKTAAESLVEEASAEGKNLYDVATERGLSPQETTFDSESTWVNEELRAAADALDEMELTDVIESDSSFYVAQVTSLSDEVATEDKKLEIIGLRQNEVYNEVVDGWKAEADIVEYQEVLDKIDFNDYAITMVIPEVEETTE